MDSHWFTAVYDNVVRVAAWRRWFRAVMVSTVVLCAQSGDWAQVQALAPGAQVEVKQFSVGGVVRGTIESVSDEALVIQRKTVGMTVDRADVQRVRLCSAEKSKSGRITGAAILGGLSVPAAAISDGASPWGRVAIVPAYAGIGYLIGWAFDGPKRITIYKAERP